jgi:hypothetical protein
METGFFIACSKSLICSNIRPDVTFLVITLPLTIVNLNVIEYLACEFVLCERNKSVLLLGQIKTVRCLIGRSGVENLCISDTSVRKNVFVSDTFLDA